jgi:tRNA(adenine34) deaminase
LREVFYFTQSRKERKGKQESRQVSLSIQINFTDSVRLDSCAAETYISCLSVISVKLVFMNETDEFLMRAAIKAAVEARETGEIPIGACLTNGKGEIIAVAGNRTITNNDPTAHAEILVLREAAAKIGNYRLNGATIYTTIEPCAMCAGALVNARIKRLVFGALDERFGAVETLFRICDNSSLNHRIDIKSGVLAEECRNLMRDFFRRKRNLPKLKIADSNLT